MSMTMSQVQRPYSLSQNKFYAHQTNVSPNKWFRTGNEGSNSYFEEFKVNSLALQRGGTTEGSRNILSDYAREDYFDDLSLSLMEVWVTQVSYFTPHRNVAVFDPPTDDMRCDQAMTRTASFEIKDLFYVNNKLEVYVGFMARLSAYIVNNKKQMATVVVEIKKANTTTIEKGKMVTTTVEKKVMDTYAIKEKGKVMDVDAIKEKGKAMDTNSIKEKQKAMDTDAFREQKKKG
ncbi:hypothetical protein JHK87_052954 [Glycine soja]|nr:hypothetical protein JHK87_052954 [Glycine soja]